MFPVLGVPMGGGDSVAPTVVLTTDATEPVSAAFTVTATFSEDVTGFTIDDLTVTNGAASNFAGSGASYTATITPDWAGDVSIVVLAGACVDGAGNENVESAALGVTILYDAKALTVQPAALLSHLALMETAGSVAADSSGNSRTGSYSAAVQLAADIFLDGSPAPDLNNGFINWYTTGLRDVFNGAELSVGGWLKFPNGVWSSAGLAFVLYFYTATGCTVQVYTNTTANAVAVYRAVPANADAQAASFRNSVSWQHLMITVSESANRLRMFLNGELLSETSDIGAWGDLLVSTNTMLGAQSNLGTNPFGARRVRGWTIWATELTPPEVLALHNSMRQTQYMMFIGDSKTVGGAWCNWLRQSALDAAGIAFHVGPTGYATAGWTIANIKTYIDANLTAETRSADIILVNSGSNDSATSENNFKTSYRSIVASLKAKWPGVPIYLARPVVLTAVPPSSPTAANATVRGWINDLIAEDAIVFAGLDETDLEGGNGYATNLADITHYTSAGQTAVAALWTTKLGY
jgi:hypothetical protein